MRRWLFAQWTMASLVASGFASAATLEVDSQRSKITVAVVTSVHDFVGEVTAFQTTIDCDPNERLPARADVAFDFKDLQTGSKGRDKDMLKWLKYASNPKAMFHLTGWKQEGTNSFAIGELTLHGIKQAIQMPVTVKSDGDNREITGTARLDYRDFKLPVIRKVLLFSVDPHLTVRFQLIGTLVNKK